MNFKYDRFIQIRFGVEIIMYKMGIIEESLENNSVLGYLESCLFSKRIEHVPEDEYPEWHVNEYHITDENLLSVILNRLANTLKKTWYIHIFNEDELYVVMYGKWFEISPQKDNSWDEMIKYGVEIADVEQYYLENISLTV